MLFNGRTLIFTFSRTQVRIAEIERLQSLFKTSMAHTMAALKKMWKYLQLRSDENHVMDVQRYGHTRIMISNTQKL